MITSALDGVEIGDVQSIAVIFVHQTMRQRHWIARGA